MDIQTFINSCRVDLDGDGYVSRPELVTIMKKCRVPVAQCKKNAEDFFSRFDPKRTGFVDLHEFLREFIRMSLFNIINMLKCKDDLSIYDVNNDGEISQNELLAMMQKQLGKHAGIEFVSKLFADIDIDQSGLLSFKEIIDWYNNYHQNVRAEQDEHIKLRENNQKPIQRRYRNSVNSELDSVQIDMKDNNQEQEPQEDDENNKRCRRCGIITNPADNTKKACKEHIPSISNITNLTCKKCDKNYPTFGPYQDGCTPCSHIFESNDKNITTLEESEHYAALETLCYVYDRIVNTSDKHNGKVDLMQVVNGAEKFCEIIDIPIENSINELFLNRELISKEDWKSYWEKKLRKKSLSGLCDSGVLLKIQDSFKVVSDLDVAVYDSLMEIFNYLDKNNNNQLEYSEVTRGMKKGLKAMGMKNDEIAEQIKLFLLDIIGQDDEKINQEQWLHYWEKSMMKHRPSWEELEEIKETFGLNSKDKGFSSI